MKKLISSSVALVLLFSATAATAVPYPAGATRHDRPTRRDIRENNMFSVNDRDRDVLAEITYRSRPAQEVMVQTRGAKRLARAKRLRNLRNLARRPKAGHDRYRILYYAQEDFRDWVYGIHGVYSNETSQLSYDRPTRRDIIKGAEVVRKAAERRGIQSEWIKNL